MGPIPPMTITEGSHAPSWKSSIRGNSHDCAPDHKMAQSQHLSGQSGVTRSKGSSCPSEVWRIPKTPCDRSAHARESEPKRRADGSAAVARRGPGHRTRSRLHYCIIRAGGVFVCISHNVAITREVRRIRICSDIYA